MKSAIHGMEVALVVWVTAMFCIAQTPQENAWSTLNGGLDNKTWEKRAKAATVLGELKGDKKAEEAAIAALKDDRGEVRSAAAQALGEMGAKSAIPILIGMMNDKEPAVILAASRALIALGDDRGYDAFYAVLTGEAKTGTSLTDQEKKMLHDPKKLASTGLEFGVGFIPFGGFAWSGYKVLTRDDASPVLAAAALVLAKDPDPRSGEALANAAKLQEKWLVRAAAFDAIAKRGDPSLLPTAIDGLQDPQDEVQYSAAGAILRLSDIKGGRTERPKPPAAKSKTTPKKSQ